MRYLLISFCVLFTPWCGAEDIFKCIDAQGRVTYSNLACVEGEAETVYQETEAERLQRLERQRAYEQQRRQEAQRVAREQALEGLYALIETDPAAARAGALEQGIGYDELLLAYQRRLLAQQRQQQAEMTQERQRLADLQAALAQQQRVMSVQQQELIRQQQELREQLDDLERYRQWRPLYLPHNSLHGGMHRPKRAPNQPIR